MGVIVPQSILNRRKEKILLLDILNAWEELMIALKEISVILYTRVKDLVFSVIQSVNYICS